MKKRTDALRNESGFTIIEVMVAGFVLVIGVLGVVLMANNANAVTSTTRAREGATNLARELLEQGRALPYADLTNTTAVDDLQARGYADDDAGKSGWQIRRRGIEFDVVLTACVFDDSHDGARASGADFCPGSVAAGSTTTGLGDDPNPDDYRRLEVNIQWTFGNRTPSCAGQGGNATGLGTACVTQASMIANPSGGLGPAIKSVTPASEPVESGSSVAFHVVTNSPADSLTWDADDGSQGTATETPSTSGTGWDFTWSFPGQAPTNTGVASAPAGGNVADGTHTVVSQAFLLNAAGVSKPRTIQLNRYLPSAPTFQTPAAGVNTRIGGQPIVEISWQRNPETDIWGYQVYRAQPNASGAPSLSGTVDTPVCSTDDPKATTCFDPDYTGQNPTSAECPAGTPSGHECATYYIVAFDKPWTSGNPSDVLDPCPTASPVPISLPLPTTAPLSNQGSAATRRPGCPSAMISVDITAGLQNARPEPPSSATPSCTTTGAGLAVINWTPPASPDSADPFNPSGDQILSYRVYRDPSSSTPAYTERTNLLAFSGTTGYIDPIPPGSTSHTYYVTSVDARFQESNAVPFTWSAGACP